MTNAPRPMTYDRLKSLKKPQSKSIRISTDPEATEEFEEASQERAFARIRVEANPEDKVAVTALAEAETRYKAARDAAMKNSIKFTFRSVGRKRYDALVANNKPTEDQRKDAESRGDDPNDVTWNVDTFPKALVAASITEPELSEDEVNSIWDSDDFSGPELMTMFMAALEVNTARGVVDLGKD